jgi:GNAT superfamily N-acetyltransferase
MKTYNNFILESFGGIPANLKDVLDDCQPFISELKKCIKYTDDEPTYRFLTRGFDSEFDDIQKFDSQLLNRKPSDTPKEIHDYVDENFRNKGIGTELYYDFEEQCYDNNAKCIILESDSDENQLDDFKLDSWYESLDFEIIGIEGGNSIMMKKL